MTVTFTCQMSVALRGGDEAYSAAARTPQQPRGPSYRRPFDLQPRDSRFDDVIFRELITCFADIQRRVAPSEGVAPLDVSAFVFQLSDYLPD